VQALQPTMADLDSAFADAERTAEERKNALKDHLARRQADDRSFIAKLIVWSFVILMGWVVVATSVGAYFFDWNELTEPAKFLMTILSSVMLPVVTLVIGYYFGTDK